MKQPYPYQGGQGGSNLKSIFNLIITSYLTDKSRGQDAGDRLRFDILAIGGWLGNWQPFLL